MSKTRKVVPSILNTQGLLDKRVSDIDMEFSSSIDPDSPEAQAILQQAEQEWSDKSKKIFKTANWAENIAQGAGRYPVQLITKGVNKLADLGELVTGIDSEFKLQEESLYKPMGLDTQATGYNPQAQQTGAGLEKMALSMAAGSAINSAIPLNQLGKARTFWEAGIRNAVQGTPYAMANQLQNLISTGKINPQEAGKEALYDTAIGAGLNLTGKALSSIKRAIKTFGEDGFASMFSSPEEMSPQAVRSLQHFMDKAWDSKEYREIATLTNKINVLEAKPALTAKESNHLQFLMDRKGNLMSDLFEKYGQRGEFSVGGFLPDNQADDLLSEAKKYKSADEFIADQNKYVYHNSSQKNLQGIKDEGLLKEFGGIYNEKDGQRIFFSEDPNLSTAFGGGADTGSLAPLLIRTKKGNLGGQFTEGTISGGTEIKFSGESISPNKLEYLDNGEWKPLTGKVEGVTKSQLTDIWNKANKLKKGK